MSKANQHLEAVQAKIIEQMETVGSDWVKPWINAGIATNASTEKVYRGINLFHLGMICSEFGYEHNEWMTFKQAEAKGFKIISNKDMPDGKSTSQIIIFYKPMPKSKKYYTPSDNANFSNGKIPMIPMLKSYRVFNACQIDGYTPKAKAKLANHVNDLSKSKTKEIDLFFANTKANIKITGDVACYVPSIDEIRMPSKDSFFTAVDFYSTQAHESTHWTGSKTRLNRLKANAKFGSASYAFEELVAEIGSTFLCAKLGIEAQPREDHAKYLNSWIKVLKNDSKALYRAFSQAQKAVDFLDNLQEEVKLSKVA